MFCRMSNTMRFLVFLYCSFPLFGRVDPPEDAKKSILDAIHQGADYACRALLDENGKSRCDYYLLEGRWSDYEPPWHTGQLIYALTRAYEITRKPQYLEAARKAGNWWIGLEIQDPPNLRGMVKAVHQAGIDYIVFATVTDGTAGLFRLYETTGDSRYADVPTRAGQWMLEHMYEPASRMFYDAVDPQSGEVMKNWSPFSKDTA